MQHATEQSENAIKVTIKKKDLWDFFRNNSNETNFYLFMQLMSEVERLNAIVRELKIVQTSRGN